MEFLFFLSSGLIIYSYVIYPAFLLLWDQVTETRLQLKTDETVRPVSIIVAAYNEDKVIKSRIENLLSLDYPKDKLEIIIASDGSSDQTAAITKEYEKDGITLFDYKERRGKVNVLNETVQKAKYNIVVFSDANTMFKRDALRKLVTYFADERVGCVVGGLQFVNAKGSSTGELEGVYWRYETVLKKLEGARGSLLGANGAIFGLRKHLFTFLPADTIVEDFVVPMKILENEHYVVYAPEAVAIEEAAHKIIQEKQRRIRIGAGDFQALFRLWPLLNPARGFPALAFWSHKVLRWLGPFFMIIAFLTNLLLIKKPFFKLVFVLQYLFYIFAFLGQVFSRTGKNFKLFSLCYYFVSMNIALFQGFIRYVSGTQSVKWKRTER
jgi:biofilm PGA synthesis N-glycosyltransferase PgaC